MNQKNTLFAGSVFGLLAVASGAFGAHALKPILLESGKLDVYELAVRYQFYHALALLATGVIMQFNPVTQLRYAATSFVIGILLFSGSLFALAFLKLGMVGIVTPIGGIFLIGGWAFLAMASLKKK